MPVLNCAADRVDRVAPRVDLNSALDGEGRGDGVVGAGRCGDGVGIAGVDPVVGDAGQGP